MKRGELVVLRTPNVRNATPRIRHLLSGFPNLFVPLPVGNNKPYSMRGHITPNPYFCLAHAHLDARLENVELSIDRVQRTSIGRLVAFYPFILLNRLRFMARERYRFKTNTAENEPLVASRVSWPLLAGSTIVVSTIKPAAAAVPTAASLTRQRHVRCSLPERIYRACLSPLPFPIKTTE